MHTENLFIDKSSNRETVKTVSEYLPHFNAIPLLALVIESVDTVYRGTLMVPTQEKEVLFVFDLVGEEEANGLDTLLTAVYIVPKEQIVRSRWVATVLKQPQEI